MTLKTGFVLFYFLFFCHEFAVLENRFFSFCSQAMEYAYNVPWNERMNERMDKLLLLLGVSPLLAVTRGIQIFR